MEAWEKVIVSAQFLSTDPHSGNCISCHGGRSGKLSKEDAHTGLVRDPSSGDAPACKNCHAEINDRHLASLHFTQNGYHTQFAVRGAGPTGQVDAMFEARCSSCHTSCGQCHISRPNSIQGGLVNGHVVQRRPSQQDNCTACHGSRIGNEFRGENKLNDVPIPGDVHYLNLMNCFHCHDGDELHGDGTTPANRYEAPGAPTCLECHPDVEADDNIWHGMHGRTTSGIHLSCQVCHSQPYKSCYGCHVKIDSQGLRHPSRIDFRIGKNPASSPRHSEDYVVVRHIPIAPDTYEPWGISLATYSSQPTWRYATPHNIKKHTTQAYPPGYPEMGTCLSGCHGRRELFLTAAYVDSLTQEGLMVTEETQANEGVVVGP